MPGQREYSKSLTTARAQAGPNQKITLPHQVNMVSQTCASTSASSPNPTGITVFRKISINI